MGEVGGWVGEVNSSYLAISAYLLGQIYLSRPEFVILILLLRPLLNVQIFMRYYFLPRKVTGNQEFLL